MTEDFRFEVVDSRDITDEWRTMAEASRNVFATPEWAETWWHHFGSGRESLTVLCRQTDGRPLAILPLYLERRGGIRIVRFVGDGAADQLGPVCAASDVAQSGRAMHRFLTENQRRFDLFIGRSMDGGEDWSRLLGARALNRQGSPRLRLARRSWDDIVAQHSKHFRERVVAGERRLRRRNALEYRLVRDRAELDGALDTLLRLHSELRGDRPSSFLRIGQFHRDFAARALASGWLRLWTLELEGEPAASVLDYSFCGVVSGYQLGIQQRWRKKLNVRMLVANSIRAACEDGASEYRFGRGAEDYKYQLAEADPGVLTVVSGGSRLGQALAWGMHRARSARPVLRNLQEVLDGLRSRDSSRPAH
jgi:CelD/BcsL family acetyltransferase involved in cellulose biosynthesis